MRLNIQIIILLTLALGTSIACVPAEDGDEYGSASLALVDGTPEAIGLLTFLNDPTTSIDVLDHEVPLNRRAARNLISYRDGWDRIPGTYDDNLFDDVQEVDDVRWIGPKTLGRLVDFAISQGWVPFAEDFLGTWDGVSFSVVEAGNTLALTNDATLELLDKDLGLDRRAAQSIVEAQPISTVEELAGLYYVGKTALSRLKSAAAVDPALNSYAQIQQ